MQLMYLSFLLQVERKHSVSRRSRQKVQGLLSSLRDLPGVRTVVKQGETGLLVQPKNAEELQSAMLRLHEDQSLRESLGESARHHALPFTWDRHIDQLIQLYEGCRHHE